MATFEIKATIPYALRNEGCAVDEADMRRKAADYIEHLERELFETHKLLADAYAAMRGDERHSDVVRRMQAVLWPSEAK